MRRRARRLADPVAANWGVPTRIASYPILRKLGEGGMGVVFAAYDEMLDRKLAIKLLRPRKRKQDGTRLLREAQGLARLSHANVVQIYETGEHEGAVFMAMEFVAGQTLGEWLEAQPRPRAEILRASRSRARGGPRRAPRPPRLQARQRHDLGRW